MYEITFGKERLETIMFTRQQYLDLIRFCTSYNCFSLVNIDTTFNLGKFYVTFLTYRNLSLTNQTNENHPTFIGPIMIHLHRDKRAYSKFACTLRQYDRENNDKLLSIQCFITDDDVGLHSAFREAFPKSQFMLCGNHLKKDFQKVMSRYRVDDESKEDFLEIIFGLNGKKKESLLGSENTDEFEERANKILDYLVKFRNPLSKLDLSEWFQKYMLKKIYNKYSKIKWTHLAKINDYYTTNDIESSLIT